MVTFNVKSLLFNFLLPALQQDLQWKIPVPALRNSLTRILCFRLSPLSAEFAGIFQAGASVLLWLLDRALNSLEILIQPHPSDSEVPELQYLCSSTCGVGKG